MKLLLEFALQNAEMALEFKTSFAMTETQTILQNATQIVLEMCLDGIALGEVQQLLHHVFLFVATKFKLEMRIAMMETISLLMDVMNFVK